MPKSEQERKEWAEQELRYRKIEGQIGTRWAATLLLPLVALQTWMAFRSPSPQWAHYCIDIPIAAVYAAWTVRIWVITFRFRRETAARLGRGRKLPQPIDISR